MKTILITGGAGFIGSHVAEAYLARGWRTVVVDNFFSGTHANLAAVANHPHLHVHTADIRDRQVLREIFDRYRPDLLNHHAAQKSVAYSVEDPLLDLDINGRGFLNVLLCAGDFEVPNIVYISSGGALSKDIQGDEQSCECDPPQIISPYALNKFAGERYLAMYRERYGYQFTVLRYANVYGPRQIPDGECGVIPIFVNNILAGRESVLMTYPDMPRGCTRDYVYVSDVVRANILAGDAPTNSVINIGTGVELSVMDVYEKMVEIFGKNVPLRITGPREGDLRRSVLDPTRAKLGLGWEPEIDLEEGLHLLKESMEK